MIFNLNKNGVDYVVEQGESGGWSYRKWNSGNVEAWRDVNYSNLSVSASGNVFRTAQQSTTIPNGLFTKGYRAFANEVSNQYNLGVTVMGRGVNVIKWVLFRTQNSNAVGTVNFYLVGK